MSLLRQLRIEQGLSIPTVAGKIGVPAGYLSEIERGMRNISKDRAEQIAEVYGVALDDIFMPTRYAVRVN